MTQLESKSIKELLEVILSLDIQPQQDRLSLLQNPGGRPEEEEDSDQEIPDVVTNVGSRFVLGTFANALPPEVSSPLSQITCVVL